LPAAGVAAPAAITPKAMRQLALNLRFFANSVTAGFRHYPGGMLALFASIMTG